MRGWKILFIVGVIFLVGGLCSIGSTAIGTEKSAISQQANMASISVASELPQLFMAQILASVQKTHKKAHIINLNHLACGCGNVQRASVEFAEVEILLSGKYNLAANDSLMAMASCSGPYSFGENNDPVIIPDYPGYFDPFAIGLSPITISGPSGRVNCIEVHYEIVHSWVGDLEVVLTNEDFSQPHYLWSNKGGSADSISETEAGITAFNGETVNQTWYLLAVDTFGGDSGYIDSWWIKVYYEQSAPPANDDCANAIAIEEAVPYEGNTIGATGDYQSGWGDANDVNDVWHSFTLNSTGLVKISLGGSTFDTTLAVFDQCGGTELASNDDSCEDYTSEIQMLMTAGNTYFIRVAGFDYDQGDYTLTVTSSPALLPAEPDKLSPVDGAVDVQTDTILSWHCTIAAAKQVQDNSAAETSSKNTMRYETIYGKDDRVDEYNVMDVNILAVGDSTAILVLRSDLVKNSDGTFSLPRETFAEWYFQMTGWLLCPDEPFRNQPAPGSCSGFLVAPDIIVTSGHCLCPQEISQYAFVFGFVMTDPNTAVLKINESNIYYCKEIIAHQEGFPDWDLIRLDKEVTGHNPLPLRHTGIIPDGQSILNIGYPWGLPRKYTAGATVLDNTTSAYFQANLDLYSGSSGAAVFNADTLVVEGIVFAGPEDFVEDGPCDRSKVCPDTGCYEEELHLEYIARVTEFSPLIPTFDVYLGTNPNKLNLVCPDDLVPWCVPCPLQAGKTYYWKVVAGNCYGQTEGPVSSFTTVK